MEKQISKMFTTASASVNIPRKNKNMRSSIAPLFFSLVLLYVTCWRFSESLSLRGWQQSTTSGETSKAQLRRLVNTVSKHRIPAQVRFIKITSSVPNSRLACNKTDVEIHSALERARLLWEAQAGIVLDFQVEELVATEEMDANYEHHLARFAELGITSPHNVSKDLARIVQYETLVDQWTRENQISLYCIGAFHGYNAVAVGKLIFARTIVYRADDLPMDHLRFSRVLAHEIGHSFRLHHPSSTSCVNGCKTGACLLMCQQKGIPAPHDARLAVSLSEKEVGRSRKEASRTFDVRSSSAVVHGMFPFDRIAKGVQAAKLVWFPEPLAENVVVNKIRFQLAKLTSGRVGIALVCLEENNTVRVVAWNWFGAGGAKKRSIKGELAELVFDSVDFSWWTPRRHVEAGIRPAVEFQRGEKWGLMFSSLTSVAIAPCQQQQQQQSADLAIPEFAKAIKQRKFVLQTATIEQVEKSVVPKMNLM